MTGIKKDMYTAEVFRELTAAGAPEEILYLAKPHLGTDRLAQIVQNIRAEIVSLGGEYRFQNRLEDLLADDDGLKAVKIRDAGGAYTKSRFPPWCWRSATVRVIRLKCSSAAGCR